jgi:DNA helicase II / ATP-dependent DNA helicase PcrA
LLYVPLKFHITGQSRQGDAHVYGGRSRFLTEKVLKCFEAISVRGSNLSGAELEEADASTLNVGARLKEMW